ncbi:hypothetical protein [Megasphaera sp.]|uniref:hypothetical protein n=1 Tax=Megasphaera sp. TaxID=2023260 RepID=UPI003F7E1FAE
MRTKRTFALSVVDSDSFLSLPRSARLLYYDLGMRADDRGFILSPRRLLRSIDAQEKDLKVLLKAGYVYQFPSGVVVIMDWPVHNSVRRDRFVETTCQAELAQLEWQPGRRYHVVQSGDNMSPRATPVARTDRPSAGTHSNTHKDSSVWLNDTMNGSTNGSAANTKLELSGSPVYQPKGKPVPLPDDKPNGIPSNNHKGVVADTQAQLNDGYHITHLVELLAGFGITKEHVNQLIKLPHIRSSTEIQLQNAYDYAQKHAKTNATAYLDKILRNPQFFDSVEEKQSN